MDSAAGDRVRRRTRRALEEPARAASLTVAYSAGDEMTRRRVRLALTREGLDAVAAVASIRALAEAFVSDTVDAVAVCCDRALLDCPNDLQLLRSDLPDTAIVVICPADGRRPVRKALAAGADGYVCEAEIERALGPTLRAVVAGQLCLPRDMRAQFQRPAFSYREKQVLQLVARGFTNGEIAQALFLAESTVKSHLSSSFRKLGVGSRKEAAAIVLDPDSGLGIEVVDTAPEAGAAEITVTP